MSYVFLDELNEQQIEELNGLFEKEWWTMGRKLQDIKKMLANSDILVALCDSNTMELVGFSRVLTDYTYKALILDVIVKETYRGKELGKALLNQIIEHPLLTNVKHFELYCRPEMQSFYQKWGFTDELKDLHFMRKVNR